MCVELAQMLKNAKLKVHIVFLHETQFPRSYIASSNTKQRHTFNNAIMDKEVTFIILDISVYNMYNII